MTPVYLHIPKTAGTAIKNLKIDYPKLPLHPARGHSYNINNFPKVAFGVRDPWERFCSGYWERVTQPERKLLNSKAPVEYRRSGYRDLASWEISLFDSCPTPNDLITVFKKYDTLYENIILSKSPLTDLMKPYTFWIGDLEYYKTVEHKVVYAFNVSNLTNIFETLFNVALPKDPFLKRSRDQFDIEQSYFISDENLEWFKEKFRKDDYVLLDYIKTRPYYRT